MNTDLDTLLRDIGERMPHDMACELGGNCDCGRDAAFDALDAIVRAMAARYDRVCAAVGEHFDTTTSGGDEGREPEQIVEVIETVAGRMTALELALLDSYRRNGSAQINGGPWQQMFQPWTEAEVDSIHALPPAPRTQEASNG